MLIIKNATLYWNFNQLLVSPQDKKAGVGFVRRRDGSSADVPTPHRGLEIKRAPLLLPTSYNGQHRHLNRSFSLGREEWIAEDPLSPNSRIPASQFGNLTAPGGPRYGCRTASNTTCLQNYHESLSGLILSREEFCLVGGNLRCDRTSHSFPHDFDNMHETRIYAIPPVNSSPRQCGHAEYLFLLTDLL